MTIREISEYGVKTCPTCGSALDKPLALETEFADFRLDMRTFVGYRGGRRIRFTPREGKLLQYLMRRPGQIRTRTMIMERAWNVDCDAMLTNHVDVYVNYVRKKVDKGFEDKLIHTIRGIGYMFGTKEMLP